MFKRILFSVGTMSVVVAAAFVGTQALLSDDVELTANTFSTGSVDLQIWDVTSATYVESTVGFTDTMLPGEPSGPHVIWLKNNGSGVDLAISAAATVSVEEINSDDVTVTLEARSADGSTSAGTPVTQTLTAWETPTALGSPNIPTDDEQRYHMTVEIAEAVTASDDDVTFDFTFTGTQVAP
ncbi:MAG: hypothetical protein UU81_C0065G0001 [Microgenomates group bacterium GW2011_GWC1_41_8]|uniref:Uncharacterized protein n=1 Tax=Candidatus Roizmanbacteria bacterium GW2011_GWB1_40_7 TaxID=1618482 RepID=A0A0G0T693_9BACT|nr:MAG: hypothetical protein UU14_C0054G0002 [Candidatus Roizmanbacteria bacterium GW2011_GWB1_40_7]KKS21897.1 MAG: hypothetical protein UU81_C0065G0001 [Microgenomates group bacterium GW2011_GWC1_41_8]